MDDTNATDGKIPSGGGYGGEILETDKQLPNRLFATDRYPNSRLNVYSKPKLLSVVLKALANTPELERIKNSPLGVLFELPVSQCSISCKLIHALLTRQLVTQRKYEMWTVFGGQPLRFSLAEFREISGLPCGEYPRGYNPEAEPKIKVKKDPVWQEIVGGDSTRTLGVLVKLLKRSENMSSRRKLGLALILIVDGVLIGKHQVNKPTPKYVRMLEDIDAFLRFPWGRESFLKTVASIRPGNKGRKKCGDPVDAFCQQLQQQTIALKGFPLILQLLAFRSIPLLLNKLPNSDDARTLLDPGAGGGLLKVSTLTMNDLIEVENDPKLVVRAVVPIGNGCSENDWWGEWDDEVRDKQVLYLEGLIKGGSEFDKAMWPGGDASLELVEIEERNSGEVDDIDINVPSESSDVEAVTTLKRKRKKAKNVGSRRRKQLEEYYEPEVRLRNWIQGQLNEVKTALTRKIEKQAEEIERLKRNQRRGRRRRSFGKLSTKFVRGSQREKAHQSGSSATIGIGTSQNVATDGDGNLGVKVEEQQEDGIGGSKVMEELEIMDRILFRYANLESTRALV